MVTFQQLHDLRLGKLKKAVDDWKVMVDDLKKLAGEEGDGQGATAAGLAKKAKAADWKGDNATVTRKFVTKTAGEFKDVLATASSVHVILSGLHSSMKTHKENLEETIAGAAKGVHVSQTGVVKARDDADPMPTQAQIDAVVEDIESVLKAAARSDKTAAEALRHEAKGKYNFLSTRVTSFEGAERAIKDADAFVKLAKKAPDDLTNTELARLNEWAKQNGKDPLFAERVATELGPKKSLSFFAGAMDLDSWNYKGDGNRMEAVEARKKLLGDMETRWGMTLASASRSETPGMDSWKKSVIAIGDQPVSGTVHHKPVYGFQAMSNLMRHGKYDGAFLNNYGEALVKFEKGNTGDVKDPGPGGRKRENVLPWDSLPSYAQQDQMHFGPGSEKDAGRDPMTGFMKALSQNPDASSHFFSSKEPQDNAEWVLKDRDPLNDVVAGGPGESRDDYKGPSAAWDATGDAVVAGATGLDPDNPQNASREHTPQQKAVLENSLHHLAGRGDDFPPEMRGDMAKVMVNHGDQVHYSMSAHSDNPSAQERMEYAESGQSNGRGGQEVLDRRELLEVSKQVSRDQDAYHVLNDGMHREMIHDIQVGDPKDPKETLLRAGHSVGFLEEARYQALADKDAAEKKDIVWEQNFKYHAAGTVASFIPEGHVAGIVDRGAYLASYEWSQEEQDRVSEGTKRQNGESFDVRAEQIKDIANSWKKENPDTRQAIYTAIDEANGAAANGNNAAQGLPGRQPPH